MTSTREFSKIFDFTQKNINSLMHLINKYRQFIIIFLIFLVNLILVASVLMPEYQIVNPYDEAKFVDSGWRLLRGDIRQLAFSPIVALVYAPVHLIIGNSLDWFMIELWVGRFILFSFLWWSILYLALQFKKFVSPYIMVGVLFVSPSFLTVVTNQSDAVFLGFSSLALAQLVKFLDLGKIRHLCFSSLFVGLGILARFESIVLIPILIVISQVIAWRQPTKIKTLFASISPAIFVLFLYFSSSFLLMHNLSLGISNKSYDAFEVAQKVLTNGDYDLARIESHRLFGTQEENQGSVMRAILRNPYAFSLRIIANTKEISHFYYHAFGNRLGPILFIFFLWGVVRLIRKKAFILLGLIIAWSTYILISLGFFTLHLIPQASYLLLLFSAIGVAEICDSEFPLFMRVVFLLSTTLVITASLALHKSGIVVGLTMVMITYVLYLLVLKKEVINFSASHLLALMILAVGLIARQPFNFPNYPDLGSSDQEQSIHYLEQHFAFQSIVLVSTPLPAIASKLSYVTMDEAPNSISNIKDFWDFVKEENIQGIYLDSNNRVRNNIFDLFEQGYEQYFQKAYTSPDESIRIFAVR